MNYENEIRRITVLKNIFYYVTILTTVSAMILCVVSTIFAFIDYSFVAGILNISSLMSTLLSYFFDKQTKLKTDYINELIKKNNELNSLEFNVNIPYPSLNQL